MNDCSRAVSGFKPPLGGNEYQYYVQSIIKALVHHLRYQVFSHVVASGLQTYTTRKMCDISWASQYGEHFPELAMKTETARTSQSA